MTTVFARKALLAKGWADNVRLVVGAGCVERIEFGATPAAGDDCADIVIPGLCNAHSHAFQRALVGRTEQRSPQSQDNFWGWRVRMYELANRMDATQLTAIATQAYAEMLESGYTSVVEFHYLHHEPGGDGDAMFGALQEAASKSGIRLTYVPVLYERAGFDQAGVEEHQQRFAMQLDAFLEHHARCCEKAENRTTIGIGAHSLRAVTEESLAAIATVSRESAIPMHMHIAEQQAEVEQSLSATGKRPVDWLLENVTVDEHWCLVHATHINDAEIAGLARSKAVVCICPSTEANLGDGTFPLLSYLKLGGQIAIGSDSHVTINPFEELRWLEYGQRLATQSRNVASLDHAQVGQELFGRVLAGGAQAGLQVPAGIAEGAGADLVTLNADDPMLVGHDERTLLDALIFSGYRLPIERVMVHGEWQVIDGRHVAQQQSRANYAAALEAIR
jgi:formimidoylglutamate deiminase